MTTAYPPPGDPQGQPPAQPQYQQPPAQPQYQQPQYQQPQYQQPQYQQPQYPQQYGAAGGYPPPASKTNGMAVTALILGILALLIAWIPFVNFFSIILGLAALILGFLGMKKAAEVGGKGLAIGGIITGGLALLATIVMIIGAAIWFDSASDDIDDWNQQLEELNEQIQEDLENMDTNG